MTDVQIRNNVKRGGDGHIPLLFAHGFGCDQTIWRLLYPAFERDFHTVLFDHVGFGKSDLSVYRSECYTSLDDYARDVLEICEALDLRNVIFVGHSVSATIGLLAAIRDPNRFRQLVLVCPSPRYLDDPPDYRGGFKKKEIQELLDLMDLNDFEWSRALASLVLTDPKRPELQDELQTSFCAADPVIARRFAEITFLSDNRGNLPKVRTPSLILQCEEDSLAPPEVGEYMHEHLRGSVLRRLKATGHCPQLSHPDETIRAMRNYFLDTIRGYGRNRTYG